jgi:hypothetical protein
MAFFKKMSGLLLATVVATTLDGGVASAALMVQSAGSAGSQPERVAAQCPPGWRARLIGGCTRVNQPRYTCQPGFHRIVAPTGSGYRCVQNRG